MKRNLVATLADKNYIDQAKQLFSSVYFNAGWNGDYMLLAHELPEKELEWFKKKGILVRKCTPMYQIPIGDWPITALSKLYLFTPEFKKWRTIIFLDGDIVVRGSIKELATINGFAAVRVCNDPRISLLGQFARALRPEFSLREQFSGDKTFFKKLEEEYDLKKPAFNSGVFAFNTDIIEKETLPKLKRIIQQLGEHIFTGDETVLNFYFYDKWQELPLVYNISPDYEMFYRGCRSDELKGIILHTYSSVPIRIKFWDKRHPLFREWTTNFKKAEFIDLTTPQMSKKELCKEEALNDGLYLQNLHKQYFYKHYLRIAEVYICSIGPFLRKRFPRLYLLMKKVRDSWYYP